MSTSTQKILVGLFFLIFLALGIGVYDDYGISWDELHHRYMGGVSGFYVNQLFGIFPIEQILNFDGELHAVPPDIEVFVWRHYGAFLEMVLVGFEYFLGLTDTRQIYFFRHLATFFIFFVGVYFFYLTIYRVFGSRMVALLGCTLLIVSPRIFAHGFYDLKDIAPLTLTVVGIYTLIRLLEERTVTMAMFHALSVALFIDTRVIGIFFPVITLFFLGLEFITTYKKRNSLMKLFKILAVFIGCLLLFTYLFWPYLWEDPIGRFWSAITNMSHFSEENDYQLLMVYFGEFIDAANVPWHYLPVWILITTPIVYSVLFALGTVTIIVRLLRGLREFTFDTKDRFGLLVLIIFYGPIIAVIAVNSTLLDGWRHMYFCYPAFLLIGVTGLDYWRTREQLRIGTRKWRVIQSAAVIVFMLGIGGTAYSMLINHPYQSTYFNFLAGQDVEKNWELDYWGGSFRQGLEHLLEIDNSPQINVSVSSEPGKFNLDILEGNDRQRLNIVDESEAKYHLSNYRFKKEYDRYHNLRPPFDKEIFSIEVSSLLDTYKIMGAYLVD